MSETKAEYQARMGRKFDRLSEETTRLINENQRLRAELSKAQTATEEFTAKLRELGADLFAANLRAGRKG